MSESIDDLLAEFGYAPPSQSIQRGRRGRSNHLTLNGFENSRFVVKNRVDGNVWLICCKSCGGTREASAATIANDHVRCNVCKKIRRHDEVVEALRAEVALSFEQFDTSDYIELAVAAAPDSRLAGRLADSTRGGS